MVELLSYLSLKPVNDLCNKDCGNCYDVCKIVHIKERLLLIQK